MLTLDRSEEGRELDHLDGDLNMAHTRQSMPDSGLNMAHIRQSRPNSGFGLSHD